MTKIKPLGIIIAISVTISCIGCGGDSSALTGISTGTVSENTDENPSSEDTTLKSPSIEARDYKDYEFRFIVHKNNGIDNRPVL